MLLQIARVGLPVRCSVSMSWDPTIQPMAPVNDTPEVAELDSEIKEFQNIAAALRKDQEEGTISSQVADDGDELDSEQDEEVDNERVAADLEVEVRVVQNSRVLVAVRSLRSLLAFAPTLRAG